MPTATTSPAEAGRPVWPVLLGYNAPFALWTAYALAKPLLAGVGGAWCPTHALLGWCPTCGMTARYAELLYTGRLPDAWTCCILAVFLTTAGWSLLRVSRHAQRRTAPPS